MRFSQHFKAVGTLVHGIYTIDKIYEDDKLDWDDAPTIATFIGGQILVWGGDFLDWRKIHKKPLYIIEAAVLAGGVASYAIGGREGLVAYTDILTGKIGPKDWYDVVAPEVKREAEEAVTLTLGLGGFLLRGLETYAEHKLEQIEAGYDWLTKYGRWANPLGLPF